MIKRCRECNNPSFTYLDFTSKMIYECDQCKTKYYEKEETE